MSMRVKLGFANIPKVSKQEMGGEDACFIMHDPYPAFGVADGVGSWLSNEGISAGDYAKSLMNNAYTILGEGVKNLESVLRNAYDRTSGIGSSTIILADFRNKKANFLMIGDSGYCIIRDGEIKMKSEEQERSFNKPYQIGRGKKGEAFGEGLEVAELTTQSIKKGDTIIAATDGLFDNLFDDDITDITSDYSNESPTFIASRLAIVAYDRSVGKEPTPFSVAMKKQGKEYEGGKEDDITVVVGKVN